MSLFVCVQDLQSLARQELEHEWRRYQLIAVLLRRLDSTQRLPTTTRRRLAALESRRADGLGVYRVLCRLQTTIASVGGQSSCADHARLADRIVRLTERYGSASRVQASYSAAVLSVAVRRQLRRSARHVACLHTVLRFLATA